MAKHPGQSDLRLRPSFRIHCLQGFFNISTWITALAGAVVLLGTIQLLEGQRGGRVHVRGHSRSRIHVRR